MIKVIAILAVALLGASSAFAASRPRGDCKCYTDQPNCSGQAMFAGSKQALPDDKQKCAVYGYPKSCSVYGPDGRVKDAMLILLKEQYFSVSVGYKDKFACVDGTDGVPPGTPTNRIGVQK